MYANEAAEKSSCRLQTNVFENDNGFSSPDAFKTVKAMAVEFPSLILAFLYTTNAEVCSYR